MAKFTGRVPSPRAGYAAIEIERQLYFFSANERLPPELWSVGGIVNLRILRGNSYFDLFARVVEVVADPSQEPATTAKFRVEWYPGGEFPQIGQLIADPVWVSSQCARKPSLLKLVASTCQL